MFIVHWNEQQIEIQEDQMVYVGLLDGDVLVYQHGDEYHLLTDVDSWSAVPPGATQRAGLVFDQTLGAILNVDRFKDFIKRG